MTIPNRSLIISNYTFSPQAACFLLKLIRIIGIIQFTNFYNYNLWIKLF